MDATAERGTTLVTHRLRPVSVDFHYADDPGHALDEPDDCDLLAGECFFNRGYLIAREAFAALEASGDDGLYAWLEDAHARALKDVDDDA
jgi:hypothetical protein